MKNLLLIGFMLILGQVLNAQAQEIETPGGTKFFIEEEPQSSSLQLPESLKLRATYDNGTSTYFSLDGTKGLQMFPFNQQSGSVQITSQGYKLLDFNGTDRFSISFVSGRTRVSTQEVEILGGSDLSEYFDVLSASSVAPGMLVSIAADDGSLAITDQQRDKKVVGIVSGANGIETGLMMGQRGSIADGDTPIALTGRAYVYATTENGPIEAGDFLTSSSTPGYAMKVKRYGKAKGSIVGKAMTSLEEGSGFVLVLINLQ